MALINVYLFGQLLLYFLIKMNYLSQLIVLLLLVSTTKTISWYRNIQTPDQIISLIPSPSNQFVAALTYNQTASFIRIYNSRTIQIYREVETDIVNTTNFRGFFWLQENAEMYLIYKSQDNYTQIRQYQIQSLMTQNYSLNISSKASLAARQRGVTYIYILTDLGSLLEYQIVNGTWIQTQNLSVGTLSTNSLIVCSWDREIFCIANDDGSYVQSVNCFTMSNKSSILNLSLYVQKPSFSLNFIEGSHQLIVKKGNQLWYKNFDDLTQSGVKMIASQFQKIYHLKSCRQVSENNKLVLIAGSSSNKENKIVFADLKSQQLHISNKYYLLDEFPYYLQYDSILASCQKNNIIIHRSVSQQRIGYIFSDEQYSIGMFMILAITLFLSIILSLTIVITIKRFKFIFLKNAKVYFRNKKILYTFAAFVISVLNLLIMLNYLQPTPNYCIVYYIQYLLFVLFFTLYECITEFDQINKHFSIYRLQGFSASSYVFQRFTYQFIVLIIAAVFNIFAISLINDNQIVIARFEDYLLGICAFVFCSFSNLGFFYLITLLTKRLYILIELIFLVHVLLLQYNFRKIHGRVSPQMFFSGSYLYWQIIDDLFNKMVKNDQNLLIDSADKIERLKLNCLFLAFQCFFYFGIYFLYVYFKYSYNNPIKLKNKSVQENDFSVLMSQENQQNPILKVENLSKSYRKKILLSKLCFDVNKRQIFVIYGSNQTGKTTLIRCLLSMQKADEGKVKFKDGITVSCCFGSQMSFQQLTFVEHIQYMCEIKKISKEKIPDIVEALIDDFYFERDANKRASQLSGGSLKKLCLALALVGQPDLLILDEPTLGLDSNFKVIFWKMLKKKKAQNKISVIMTTSNKQEAQFLGDNIFFIAENKGIFYDNLYRIVLDLQNQQKLKNMENLLQRQNQQFKINHTTNQITISTCKQELLGSKIIHFILFNSQLQIQFKIVKEFQAKQQINQDELSTLIGGDNQQKPSFDYVKGQISGLAKRRLHIFKYHLLATTIIVILQVVVLLYLIINKLSDVWLIIPVSYFLYFEYRILRNDQKSKNLYKNAVIFGINKSIYWILSLLLDTFLLYSINLLIYIYFGLNNNYDISLLLFIYSMIYVAVTYFFSELINNYVSFLFLFFYINGFSFYFAQQIQIISIPELMNKIYFVQTLVYLLRNKSFYQNHFNYLLYQLIFWYLLLIILYGTKKIMGSIKQTIEIPIEYYRATKDQKIEQYTIEDTENSSQIPLILDSVFYAYSNKSFVIKNVSILLKKGEVYCLIGSNGAGKSTFFNIVTGILNPTFGSLKYFGKNKQTTTFVDQTKIGYCPQFDYLYDVLTVQQNIAYLGSIKGMKPKQINEFMQKYLTYFDMFDLLKARVDTLQVGSRRKISAILAFMGNPSLLFLDEPCSGIDEKSKIKLWSLISIYCKTRGASAILTTHYVSEIQHYCDRIGILKNGRLISIGSPPQLLKEYCFRYRLIIKYSIAKEKQYIRQIIEKDQRFFNYFQPSEQYKMIYDFDIEKFDIRLILSKVIFELLEGGIIDSFQCFSHNLQNVVAYIENQDHKTSSISEFFD